MKVDTIRETGRAFRPMLTARPAPMKGNRPRRFGSDASCTDYYIFCFGFFVFSVLLPLESSPSSSVTKHTVYDRDAAAPFDSLAIPICLIRHLLLSCWTAQGKICLCLQPGQLPDGYAVRFLRWPMTDIVDHSTVVAA